MCTCEKCNPQSIESNICTSEIAAEVTVGVISGLLAVAAIGVTLFFVGRTVLAEVQYSAKQKGRREVQDEVEKESAKNPSAS